MPQDTRNKDSGMTEVENPPEINAAPERSAGGPLHSPATIQSHGAMIAVDNETLDLTHVSTNLAAVTGIDPETALGRNIYDVFPAGLRHDMVNCLLPEYLNQDTRIIDTVTLNGRPLITGASQAGRATIFEFERAGDDGNTAGDAMRQMAFLISQLHAVEDVDVLLSKSVKLLQVLTGYHRIMIHAFDAKGNGTVRAEALSGGMSSLLGLSFPGCDIPAQTREITRRTPFRYIADVNAPPVPIMAHAADSLPLDMTHSHLRGVSEVHMQYVRNMGTASTFTLNAVVENKLWGMVSMHHPDRRMPPQTVREVCRTFVQFFSLKLETILQRDQIARMRRADTLRNELSQTVSQADVDV